MIEHVRNRLNLNELNNPINLWLITSRKEEFNNLSKNIIIPKRIGGKEIYSYFISSLNRKPEYENYSREALEQDVKKFIAITNDCPVPVIIAKIFSDIFYSKNKSDIIINNIPCLILEYINYLNRQIADKINDSKVHQVAKILSQEVMSKTLLPQSVKIEQLNKKLSEVDPDIDSVLEYMDKKLNLIKIDEITKEKVRFSIDIIAEYLYAMKVVEEYKGDQTKWGNLFEKIKKNNQSKELGFLTALINIINENEFSKSVPLEIKKEIKKL